MGRVSQVIVLAEDENQQRLVRRFLHQLDFGNHDIRFEPLPSGRGSGEAWVRERYAASVQAYRARSARARTSLIVAIDADTTARRVSQLEESLATEGMDPRTRGDKIVHLIPKRNIETWILNLNGEPVDEEADYRHAPDVGDQIDSAAKTLYEWTRPNTIIPDFCVPSLRAAIPELRRLE